MSGFATLGRRLASSAVMISLMFAALFWLPAAGVALGLTLILVLAMVEYFAILRQANLPSYPVIGVTLGALASLGLAGLLITGRAAVPHAALALAFFVVVTVILHRMLMPRQPGSPLLAAALTLFGLVYLPGLFAFMELILLGNPPASPGGPLASDGRTLFIYLGFVAKCTDSGAYFVGSRWGRHKLAPVISPKKTWEGLWGGLATGILISLAFSWLGHGQLAGRAFPLTSALGLGFLLSAISVTSDLVESQIKRAVNAKDSGGILPGIGGVLDMMDSFLFTAPVLYAWYRFTA